MYKLTFDGLPVYDPRGANEDDNLIIVEPAVTLAVNAAGSVSFAIYKTHPLADRLTRMRGTLALEDDNGTIFRGRILNDEATFYGAKKYTAEGALAFLNDSIVDPYTFPDDFTGLPGYQAAADPSGNVVAWWLGWLLDKHNAQAPADRQIKLGTVTVKDANNYITRENSKYSSTWEVISDKLVGSALGGYLLVRYEDDGNYLDYLAELPRTNPQRVQFAENLLDIIIKVTGENLFTAILPVGADGLTLAGLPDGPLEGGMQKAGKIIFDPAAEAEYGSRITRVLTWDDVTIAENLQAKAAAELSAGVRLPESISARACDLHGVDGTTPHFRVGQYVRVESAPHGISAAYPLLEMTPNILDPGSTTINLNTTTAKFTAQLRAAQVAAEQSTQSAVREASKRFDDIIAHSSGLYPTAQIQPDGSTVWLLHDKQSLEESTIVIKIGSAGIGLSTDGGSSYPYGYTVTGQMVMDYIAANGIDCSWLNAGVINLALLSLAGTLCGLMQGTGRTGTGKTTTGIVMFGNGKNSDGTAKPPYLIVTSDGIRMQVSDTEYVYYSGGFAGFVGLNLTTTGNIHSEGTFAVGPDGGHPAIAYDNSTSLMMFGAPYYPGYAPRTFLRGYFVYVNDDDTGGSTYLRGADIYASRNIEVSSDERMKKDIRPLPEQYLRVLDNLTPVLYRYRREDDDAPPHIGYVAQNLQDALGAAGMSRADMAALGVYQTDDGNERMAIAYDELIAALHLKVKSLEAEIRAIKEEKRDESL